MTEQPPGQPDPSQQPYPQAPQAQPYPPQYQQPAYGQTPPPNAQQPPYYGAPGYGQPMYYAPPSHGSATTALVLGILGLVACPLVLSIPAWVIGRRAMREIDASGGQLGGRSNAKAGYVLGIIGTVWAGLAALFVIGVFVIGGVITTTYHDTCDTVTDDSGYTTTNC